MTQGRVLPDGADIKRLFDGLPADPMQAAAALVRNGHLTKFQARMLLAGKTRGFRLGDYLIKDQIGQGGMGAVYLAMHQTLGRQVAIKVLPPHSATDKITLERFLREARTAAALDHPNIVKLHDVCKQGDVRYLVMEYIEGQTLEQLLRSGGGMAVGRVVNYVAQAASGLQHAYERGFIHRDIKPANLMLTKGDVVKILDMGLARAQDKSDSLTETLDRGAVVGTADYVAPEQALNNPDVDIRADIYSLGVTFFALVIGKPPFDGSTASKLMQHQLKSAPSLSRLDKTVPPELAAVVGKMMEKKADNRFATPADVIVALQPWLTDSPQLMAGVSRTDAASGSLSSQRLRKLTDEPDDKPRKGKKGKPPAKPVSPPPWIWAVVGAAALVLIGSVIIVAVLANGGKPTATGAPIASSNPTPTPVVPPTPGPPPATAKPAATDTKPTPPVKVWSDGKMIYALDLNKIQPFEIEGSTTGMTNKTGTGDFPDGWNVKTWQVGDKTKGFGEAAAIGPAIGLRPVQGNGILFSPEIPFTCKHVKLRFEYQSAASDKLCTVRVREMGSMKTQNDNLQTSESWTKFERVYDVSEFKNAIRVEFHNSDKGKELRLRRFELLETE